MNATFVSDKLKASLLQAAIEGKLTKQLSEDGDARDLLKQIEAEKQRLIKEKTIKREKPLPPITEDEIPFAIPDNWVWARLGEVTYNHGQKKPEKAFTYIDISSIDNRNQKLGDKLSIICARDAPSRARKIVEKGDIIYATVRPYLANACIIDKKITPEPIASTGFAVLLTPFLVMNYYILYLLISPFFNTYANDSNNAKGVAYPAINDKSLKLGLLPIPPLAEQHRIVEVLETALEKIDKLKAYEIKLQEIDKAFPDKLKASLLQSAIEGKLTKQLPEDGNARDLLKQIEAEKQRLIKEKIIKREKPLPPITEDEIPFAIPDNWVWARLGEVTYNHGQKKPEKAFTYIDISSIDNRNQKLGDKLSIICARDAPSRARKIVEKGDIIYATVRPYLANACIIDKKITPEPIASTGFAVLLTPFLVMNYYILYLLISPFFNTYANDSNNAKGVAYPAINDKSLKLGLLPIPPLAEQHRIVEVLETALEKIDKLKKLIEM